jgi:two-component system NtrC family response regulator
MKALARVNGNVVKAAELLGVSRPTIYDLMNRHGIK